MSLLQNAGFVGFQLSERNKNKAIFDLLCHELVYKRQREITQLRKGLNVYGLVDFMLKPDLQEDGLMRCFPLTKDLEITSNQVLQALVSTPSNDAQNESLSYLKKLLEECNDGM